MNTLTMQSRTAEFLVKDWDPSFNRETIVINTGQNLADGAVLGQITEGDFEQFDPTSDTGIEIAVAILFGAVDATAAPAPGVALTKGPAIVKVSSLAWPDGISDANKLVALGHLASAGIIAR